MGRPKPFVWALAPLLDEARATLDEREDVLQEAIRAVVRRGEELTLAKQACLEAQAAEVASVTAIDSSVRERMPLPERRRIELAAGRARELAVHASLVVEAAGERLVRAERERTAASDARDAADVDVKELLRLRAVAELKYRRSIERDEERQRENEAMDHWRPSR